MKLDMSPWVRERLGPDAIAELREAPDRYQLSISRGRSGFGATLIERTNPGYHLLANVTGQPGPREAVEAVMAELRPLLRPVLVRGDAA